MNRESPPVGTLRARMQRGIAWNLVGTLFNQGSTLAVNIIVANLLGRQVFGEYAMIQSTLITVSTIAQMATGYTATKYVAEFRSTDKDKTGRILGLCSVVSATTACIAALAFLVGAPWLAAETLRAPHLAPGLMIAAGVVLFAVMNGFQMGALAGLESYRALAKAGILSGSSYLSVCALAAWAGGLNGALVGLAASGLIRWFTFNWFVRRESASQMIAIRHKGIWQEHVILFRFAVPAAISSFVSMPALWVSNVFLARQPGGYEQMALYSAANSFRVIVLLLPNIMNNVGMSLLNYQKGVGDETRYRKIFWVNMALTAGSVSVGALAVILFGRGLLGVFGRSFGEGYPVLLVLMLATLAEALAIAGYQVVQSREKMWLSFFAIVLPHYGAMIMLAYLLSPRYGATGLALAYAAGWSLNMLATALLAWRYGGFGRTLRRSTKRGW